MAYVVDQVLEPPSEPLTTVWPEIGDVSEAEYVQGLFSNPLSDGWGVVYRQDTDVPDFEYFLCMNWAAHRLDNDLVPGERFPVEAIWETTNLSVNDMTAILENQFQLVPCDLDDPERVLFHPGRRKESILLTFGVLEICIIWGNNGNMHSVAHIQVQHNGLWESKLSEALWAITHGEDDYENLDGWNLQKTGAYKREAEVAQDLGNRLEEKEGEAILAI